MNSGKISIDALKTLEPVGSLSDSRLGELSDLCYVERVGRNLDPFRSRSIAGQFVYLLSGELALTYRDGFSAVLVGGSPEARSPLGKRGGFTSAKAITDIELARFDDDLLDVMLTWDQLAATKTAPQNSERAEATGSAGRRWSVLSGAFSIRNLKLGAFAQLPPAHIEELLGRFKRIEARSGEVLIREGDEGDYYYVIETGRARVERLIGGVSMLLAELKSGDAFGEEALVSEAKRNATVTMMSDGALLRLGKHDFVELLREPLLHRVSLDEAREKVTAGGQFIDVRYPSEFQYDGLPGAINIPLAEIRNALGVVEMSRDYIVYCQSERRSSAAAFLFAQRGYRAFLLKGGLWGAGRENRVD